MRYTTTDVEATRSPEEAAALVSMLKSRRQELDAEFEGRQFDDGAREEFASLAELIAQTESRGSEFALRRQVILDQAQDEQSREHGLGTPRRPVHAKSNLPDNLHDLDEYRLRTNGEPEAWTALMVDGAKKVVERATFPFVIDADKAKAHIQKLLDTVDDEPDSKAKLARYIIGTGAPLYTRAFTRGLRSEFKDFGTPDMRAAISTVGTTTTGGFAVPFTLDSALILTSDGQLNPFRGICRTVTITGNTWKGLTSGGIVASYGAGSAENAAIDPDPVTFGQPSATVESAKVEIQYSIEADEDWPRLQSEMAVVIQDAKDSLEAVKFVQGAGSGSKEPEGIVAGLAAGSHVGTTGDGLTMDDTGRLVGRLPDRYEPRARFVAHRATWTFLDDLARAQGGQEPPVSAGAPATHRGYPRHNSSAMDQDYLTPGSDIVLVGDFQYFVIVDKVGLAIENDPHVRDGSGKWTGQRALLAHWRNTSVIVHDGAFRLMKSGVVSS